MKIFKSLNGNDYTVSPFRSYTNQRYEIISGSTSNPEEVTVDRADNPPDSWMTDGTLGFVNETSQIPSYTLFKSIQHLFYSSASLSRIPYGTFDIQSVTGYTPSGSCFVVNISQYAYGERVVPGTFRLDVDGSATDIIDVESSIPGLGLLYASGSNTVLGNIFYNQGLAVIKENKSATSGSVHSTSGVGIKQNSITTITFNSQITIYQHRIVCKANQGEFNYSLSNPSMDDQSQNGSVVRELFDSGSLRPYVTSIGLYNENNELLVVAKLATPIKRTKFTDQTFIVQFDSIK
jgi:hypothetical protein